MCGIAGILCHQENRDLRPNLRPMVQAQFHRGPDSEGEAYFPFGQGQLALGHRRLSILDLSPLGHQPMSHPNTGDWLVFNGEIYNYLSLRTELEAVGAQFNGHSDTEVLLHALSLWGTQALPRLEGMYTLAFFNAKEASLLLARDPLGIKPLYISEFPGGFLFASEVRSILSSGLKPAEINPSGLATFLAYGSVQEPLTLFKDIQAFPPGHYQIFKPDKPPTSPQCFWRWPKVNPKLTVKETLDSVRTRVETSIRDHLASDVPVGVFLSSGLDSTIVAGVASRYAPKLRSFTVGFADQPDMSEFPLAAETAKLFGLDHSEISITGSEAQGCMSAWLKSMDQPSIDGLNTFVISQAIRRAGITVALSGLGGDELFGGYSTFHEVPRLQQWLKPALKLPKVLRGKLSQFALLNKPISTRQKIEDMLNTDGSLFALYLQRRRALSNTLLGNLGFSGPAQLGLTMDYIPPEMLKIVEIDPKQPFWSLSQLESRFYQTNTLLRDSDTNGMAHGLEIRVPLLGQPIVDFMATVPDGIRLPNPIADKHLLRSSFAPLLRPALLEQSKRGFTLPIKRWMLSPLRDECEQALSRLKAKGILQSKGIDTLWNAFTASPESPIWTRAFALYVLATYLGNL